MRHQPQPAKCATHGCRRPSQLQSPAARRRHASPDQRAMSAQVQKARPLAQAVEGAVSAQNVNRARKLHPRLLRFFKKFPPSLYIGQQRPPENSRDNRRPPKRERPIDIFNELQAARELALRHRQPPESPSVEELDGSHEHISRLSEELTALQDRLGKQSQILQMAMRDESPPLALRHAESATEEARAIMEELRLGPQSNPVSTSSTTAPADANESATETTPSISTPPTQSSSEPATAAPPSSADASILTTPTTVEAISDDASDPPPKSPYTYNPFLPTKNFRTGTWHGPRYSLRRQAELCKLARKYDVEGWLPWSRKLSWVREERRFERGLRMKGTGEGQRVKGHKWERTMPARLERRRQAMEAMPALIEEWKSKGRRLHRNQFPSGKAVKYPQDYSGRAPPSR